MIEHRREFEEQGFTVARQFFSRAEVGKLLDEIQKAGQQPSTQDGLTRDGLVFYANCFRESQPIRSFLSQQRLLNFLCPIAGPDLWVRWDQAVAKQPGAGVFAWHQDNGYNHLLKPHYQLWIAITESHDSNGGLWLEPRSHKRGLLPHARGVGWQVEVQAPLRETISLDAQPGDLTLFSSLTLHRTGPNVDGQVRWAYVAEYMPLQDYDYYLEGPYFVVSRASRSDPHFVSSQAGARSLSNQLLYIRPRSRRWLEVAKQPLRRIRDLLLRR